MFPASKPRSSLTRRLPGDLAGRIKYEVFEKTPVVANCSHSPAGSWLDHNICFNTLAGTRAKPNDRFAYAYVRRDDKITCS